MVPAAFWSISVRLTTAVPFCTVVVAPAVLEAVVQPMTEEAYVLALELLGLTGFLLGVIKLFDPPALAWNGSTDPLNRLG